MEQDRAELMDNYDSKEDDDFIMEDESDDESG